MTHSYCVGYFDPRDLFEDMGTWWNLKVSRPFPRAAAERLLARFDPRIAPYIGYYDDDRYVDCGWSSAPRDLWSEVVRFALALAEAENAAVVSEPPYRFIFPPGADEAFQAAYANRKTTR